MGQYTHTFSHEFEAGSSGPARSYWLIHGPGAASHGTPVCLHHRDENIQPELTMQNLCQMVNVAFDAGRGDKAQEIRAVLGMRK